MPPSAPTIRTASLLAIIPAVLIVSASALGQDPDPPYFRVIHNMATSTDFPIPWPDPPLASLTSSGPIDAFASSQSANPAQRSYQSEATLTASGGILRIVVSLAEQGCCGNYAGAAQGVAEWVADDLVFTSTDGQTGTVEVQLRGTLCVSHGGNCSSDQNPECTPGEAVEISEDLPHFICCPPDFMSFRIRSQSSGGPGIPQGCLDVTGSPQTVTLGQPITWGPSLLGQLKTGIGLNGGNQTNSAWISATLRFGELQPDGSIGPVFNLPPGITVNAPSVGLIDNYFQPGFVPCPGDLDADGTVGLTDLALLLGDFGCVSGGCGADVDFDGDTDLGDLATLLSAFGQVCP